MFYHSLQTPDYSDRQEVKQDCIGLCFWLYRNDLSLDASPRNVSQKKTEVTKNFVTD